MDERCRLSSEGPSRNDKVRVAEVAGRHFGRVSHRQLIRAGVGSATIVAWTNAGYLHRVLPGVYAVGHAAPSMEAELAAALLYVGSGAMLSHSTAVWWWGLTKQRPNTIDISTPGRRATRQGIRVHDRRDIDRAWYRHLPVTPVAVALLDYAATAPVNRLRSVVAEAEYRRLLSLPQLANLLGRGKRGSRKLRAAIERHMPQLALTRSELEDILLFACEKARLPLPEVNVRLEGVLVDAVWRRQKVVVELDGFDGHHTRAQLARDHERDLRLRAAGWIVLRYAWGQLVYEQPRVIADLQAALARTALASP